MMTVQDTSSSIALLVARSVLDMSIRCACVRRWWFEEEDHEVHFARRSDVS